MAVTGELPHCRAQITSQCTVKWIDQLELVFWLRQEEALVIQLGVNLPGLRDNQVAGQELFLGVAKNVYGRNWHLDQLNEREDCGPSPVKEPRKGRDTHLHLPLRAEFGFSNLWTLDSNLKSPEFLGFQPQTKIKPFAFLGSGVIRHGLKSVGW